MTLPPPDGSRDRRIEDPSNLWVIHPAARSLLHGAVTHGISANAVSVAGLALGVGAALAYAQWQDWRFAFLGLLLSIAWLVADGLDGMVARATGSASALGRTLDGLCDHGVFTLIYVSLALSIGTGEGWALAVAAGVAHAFQSSLYEGERARFHRRIGGVAATAPPTASGGPLVRLYDGVTHSLDRLALPFERRLAVAADPRALGRRYGEQAVPALKLMALQTANVRVLAVFAACLIGDPRLFWWFEIVVLTPLVALAILLHRRVEHRLAHGISLGTEDRLATFMSREQGR